MTLGEIKDSAFALYRCLPVRQGNRCVSPEERKQQTRRLSVDFYKKLGFEAQPVGLGKVVGVRLKHDARIG